MATIKEIEISLLRVGLLLSKELTRRKYNTERAATTAKESFKFPGDPNTLINLETEKMAERPLTAQITKTPLSNGLGRQDSLPDITMSKSHETSPTPATTTRRSCLFNSRALVVNGRKNKGVKNTPTRIVNLAIFL